MKHAHVFLIVGLISLIRVAWMKKHAVYWIYWGRITNLHIKSTATNLSSEQRPVSRFCPEVDGNGRYVLIYRR